MKMSPLLKKLIIAAAVILLAEIALIGVMVVRSHRRPIAAAPDDIPGLAEPNKVSLAETMPPEEPEEIPEETDASPEEAPAVTETEAETEEVQQSAEESESEPEVEPEPENTEQVFLLHFVGDCTLGSTPNDWNSASSFVKTVGTDYGYPFEKVAEYFQNDEFTFINLEGPFTDSTASQDKLFAFKGPTAYSAILTEGSVEAVNLANNHTYDYGAAGFKDTQSTLENVGISYVSNGNTTLVTTENGLVIGLYAGSLYSSYTNNDIQKIRNAAASLRSEGAELLIAVFHWGVEGKYHPTENQKSAAHVAADAGFDIIYGSHPHVLQPTELYNGSFILYSMGNFSFGGNTWPRDRDSAIAEFEVTKNEDGVTVTGFSLIPCCLSSATGYNNYQPIPYEEGTAEYDRALSKLNGTFTGPDLVVDYSGMTGGDDTPEENSGEIENDPDDGPSDENSSGSDTGDSGVPSEGDTGSDSTPDSGSGSDSGNTPGSGSDSGSGTPEQSGGETGSSSGGAVQETEQSSGGNGGSEAPSGSEGNAG